MLNKSVKEVLSIRIGGIMKKLSFLSLTTIFSLLATISYGQWLETTVPVGINPNHLVYNSTDNKIYTANWSATNVTVIDGATNSVITTIPIGSYPHILCYNPTNNKVYTANPYSDPSTVTVIDGATNGVITTIPVGTYPYRPVYNPTNNKVYTANWTSNNVTVIDGATNGVITTITLGAPAPWGPVDLGYNPTDNKVYCANWSNNTVAVIDGATDSVITTIQAGTYPFAFVHNPTNNKVYWANSSAASSSVTVIDGETNSIITTIPVKRVPYALTYNLTNNRVYCANQWRDTVTVIDGASNSIITTIPVGDEPSALFYNPTNNKVYCANSGTYSSMGKTITIIDGATNSVLTTIEVGNGPKAFTYNPQYNRVYVANYYGNSVSVIRDLMPAFSVTPTSIAFGDVYVDSSKTDSVTVTNTGTATLDITSVVSDNAEFTVTPTAGSLVPAESMEFYITFAPTNAGAETGNIIFIHNATTSPDTITVTGTGVEVGVEEQPMISKPLVFGLAQSMPNPMRSSTTISFSATCLRQTTARQADLHPSSAVAMLRRVDRFPRIRIYNVKGQLVKEFKMQNSEGKIEWNGTDDNGKQLSNGIYLYRMETDKYKSEIRKILMLR